MSEQFDIFTGGRVEIAVSTQLDPDVNFHDPSFQVINEILAFPELRMTREITAYETFDSDTESKLSGSKTYEDTEIVVAMQPDDPVLKVLDDAEETKQMLRFRTFYVIDTAEDEAPGEQGYYRIYDAYVVGKSTTGENDAVVQNTYQLAIENMYDAGIGRRGSPLLTGDYGIGAGTADYPGILDWTKLSGNRFVSFPGSSVHNPFGTDTGGIAVQGNDNQGFQIIASPDDNSRIRIRGVSTNKQGKWIKVYSEVEKPTPADVQAVALKGDKMTGRLQTPEILTDNIRFGSSNGVNSGGTTRLIQTTGAGGLPIDLVAFRYEEQTQTPVLETGTINALVSLKDRGQSVYSPLNIPTPGVVGAVNKKGDTMSGVLVVPVSNGLQTTNNTHTSGEVYRATVSAESGYAMLWRRPSTPPTGKNFKSAEFVGINNNSALLFRQDITKDTDTAAKYKDWQVYHQGFKPTPAEIGAINVNDTIDLGTY
ncbi:hypothetical protein RIM49_003079 [Enterobacter kobei]|uniref:hypothetical protein n=1 Tax=Enterobacter kobei TaxID=208224 RepID=UPI0020C13BC2|nr:hypothetical protein [Enterobacter kobei]ELC0996429.1 hypothetical protein [Enterobacter kobei]MCL5532298.1 hypothetical protein [Enterobacter kobei]